MTARSGGGELWSIVLAGGEGERLRTFVEQRFGRARPKQYCTFVGNRSLLQHTIDRADLLVPPERRVTVMARDHSGEIASQFRWRRPGTIVLQPANRDTAAGIFLPLSYVRAHDPRATVVLYPSDHFICPNAAFAAEVRKAVRAALELNRLVLLGAKPDAGEPDYGWIEPGRNLGRRVREVDCFVEKPSRNVAAQAFSSGALWNTLVVAARLETLWQLGHQFLPTLMALFETLCEAIGTPHEGAVLDSIYRVMPRHNFSADLLERASGRVAVLPMRGVLWSDWGRPERITETLSRIRSDQRMLRRTSPSPAPVSVS